MPSIERQERLQTIGRKLKANRKVRASLIKERDRLVMEELRDGTSERDIGKLAGLSGPGVHKIKERIG